MKTTILAVASISFLMACNSPKTSEKSEVEKSTEEIVITNPTNKIGLSKDIEFVPLNPARGDKAPQAGAIYGNIRENVPTGYIGKFKNGFSSPPHIHNVTYRAIVMNGEFHNADEKSPNFWMPQGSVWTQAQGQPHITSAQGENAMAYIQIETGPYLVKPVSEAFESKDRSMNIDASNVMYLGAKETRLVEKGSAAKVAFLWKLNNGEQGYLLKLPSGFKGKINSKGSVFFAVVIKGNVAYTMPNTKKATNLDQGSHFESKAEAIHDISTDKETLIYIRTNGDFKVK